MPLLYTFADVVTVLLAFFVLMLALRHPDLRQYDAAFGGMSRPQASGNAPAGGQPAGGQAGGPIQASEPLAVGGGRAAPSPEAASGSSSQGAADLDLPGGPGGLPSSALQAGVNLREDPRGTVITLANDLLFAPGSAWLPPQAGEQLRKAAGLLRQGRQAVSVEGHCDDAALPAGKAYQDSWELSLARAVAVARHLIDVEGLEASRLRVAALAGSRPLVPNDSPEHRAMNRRTEIIILNHGG
jgi:chemotaxis protein MotB